MEKEHVYQQTYNDYLTRIAELDFKFIAPKLGVEVTGEDVIVPFFDKPYRISIKGITDPAGRQPHLSVSVILCKYLLMCPLIEPLGGNWMAYKDFKDAAPLIHAFSNTVTRPIAEAFSGRLAPLEKAGKKLGGYARAFQEQTNIQFIRYPHATVHLNRFIGDLFIALIDQCFCLAYFKRRVASLIEGCQRM